MAETNVILAESGEIILNGIDKIIRQSPNVTVIGKVKRYNHLCQLIDKHKQGIVVLGPMISKKYSQLILQYLKAKYPYLKVVEIDWDDNQLFILNKISEAISGLELKN